MSSESESEDEEDMETSKMKGNGKGSFCLSESDSSEDESPSRKKNRVDVKTETENIFLRQNASQLETEDKESSSKLLALAGNLKKVNEIWKETEQEPSPVKSSSRQKGKGKVKKRKSVEVFETVKKPKHEESHSADSITKLLAQGEGVEETLETSDEEAAQPVMPSNGVEITVALPEHLRKKKKKSFDLEAHLKREMAKVRRDISINIHKVGVVCSLAHLLHINHVTSSPDLQCLALSLIPQSHVHTPTNLTLLRLGQLASWLKETVPINKHSSQIVSIKDMTTRIENALSTLLAMSSTELVLIFVLMCRALGMETRIVMNLTIPPKTETSKSSSSGKVKAEAKNDPSSKVMKETKRESPTSKPSKLSSKLAAAAKARKSKRLDPNASEESIIKTIEDNADEEEAPPRRSKKSKGKGNSDASKTGNSTGEHYCWVEVFVVKEKRWISVDILTGKVHQISDLESRLSKPVLYILAANNKGKVKDVSRRYCSNFLTQTRKLRVDQNWFEQTLQPWIDEANNWEDAELTKKSEEAPLPTNVSAFKGHPLYVLQRHLLKFEAIYPADAPTLGFIKGEGIYARECVHTLQGRTSWLKEGRVVRIGEEPYKVVKARPKWDRMSGCKKADEPLDLFGPWQTEKYIPPVAVDGKVPRNEYGNVELFKPWMLPGGCVHVPINGMQSVIRKSGIDAAPAMIGWDFSGGGAHPVFDGYVVCKENADALMDAWNQAQELAEERAREKREKRILDNWKKLVKGLLFREKVRSKYIDK